MRAVPSCVLYVRAGWAGAEMDSAVHMQDRKAGEAPVLDILSILPQVPPQPFIPLTSPFPFPERSSTFWFLPGGMEMARPF